MTTGKTIALTRRSFVGKVMSLVFNMLSRLAIIREMQIKTTMRYHLMLVRIAVIQTSTNKCREGAEKRESFYTVGGNAS